METLTARKKARKAARLAPAPEPKPTLAERYAPPPLTVGCTIAWADDAFTLETRPGLLLTIPATERGMEILKTILRARASAVSYNVAPALGSSALPTQHQVETWLKLRTEREAQDARAAKESAREAAQDTSQGF